MLKDIFFERHVAAPNTDDEVYEFRFGCALALGLLSIPALIAIGVGIFLLIQKLCC